MEHRPEFVPRRDILWSVDLRSELRTDYLADVLNLCVTSLETSIDRLLVSTESLRTQAFANGVAARERSAHIAGARPKQTKSVAKTS